MSRAFIIFHEHLSSISSSQDIVFSLLDFCRDFKEVNIDADRFMKDIESMVGSQGHREHADDDSDGSEGSSMDMDFGISLL